MASFSRKTGVIGALAVAGVLIGGAYVLSSSPSLLLTKTANAESTQQLLQAYAQKDSDSDGLPDWQEALYGTDPNNAHSFSPTLTDGQAVSQGLIKPKFQTASTASSTDAALPQVPGIVAAQGSLTDQFAQQFFSQYISQQNGDSQPTADDINAYATNAMQTFITNHAQVDPYTISQVHTQGSGTGTLKTYIEQDEYVLSKNTVSTEQGEIQYFSDAVEKNDTAALQKLAVIGNAYSSVGQQLIVMSVPTEIQSAHLELANATSRLGADITDMSKFSSDPLLAYIGLTGYQSDVRAFVHALSDIHSVAVLEQVTFSQGDSGYDFYSITSNLGEAPTN